MTSCSGRYGDFPKLQAALVEMGRIPLFHANRAAATADISGKSQQFLYRNHIHRLVTGGFRSFFQIQFSANRDAKNMDSCPVSPCNQGFEYLFRWKTQGFRGVIAVEVVFVVFIKSLAAGNLCLLYQPNCVGF